jgi:hypothetical protein
MLLSSRDILTQGENYTFTYEHGSTKGHMDSWVLEQLMFNLSEFGDVLTARSDWFSGRYVITVTPKNEFTLKDWKEGFAYAWNAMDYKGTFIQAEGGSVSHAGGGIHQLVVDTVKGVSDTVGEAASGGLGSLFKNIAPWVALAAAAFLVFEYTKGKVGKAG